MVRILPYFSFQELKPRKVASSMMALTKVQSVCIVAKPPSSFLQRLRLAIEIVQIAAKMAAKQYQAERARLALVEPKKTMMKGLPATQQCKVIM